MTTNRLALLVNADGERWVTEFREGDVPKMLVRNGRAFTTIMTMDTRHIDWAQCWLWSAPNGKGKLSMALGVTESHIAA
jgi:hypothetical protein